MEVKDLFDSAGFMLSMFPRLMGGVTAVVSAVLLLRPAPAGRDAAVRFAVGVGCGISSVFWLAPAVMRGVSPGDLIPLAAADFLAITSYVLAAGAMLSIKNSLPRDTPQEAGRKSGRM